MRPTKALRVILVITLILLYSLPVTEAGAQQQTATLNQKDAMKLVRIEPGSFTMGCASDDQPWQGVDAQQSIEIRDGFWMAEHEVTVAQFSAFVEETGYRTDAERKRLFRTWNKPGFALQRSDPAVFLSVRDARAYAEWAGGRLPTEPEWAYAAAAGRDGLSPCGVVVDSAHAWLRINARDRTRPVATKLPNPWGLYDVVGNAWEWTEGREGRDYSAVGDSSAAKPIIRGGSWNSCPPMMLVPIPISHADWHREDTGFRYVLDRPPPAR